MPREKEVAAPPLRDAPALMAPPVAAAPARIAPPASAPPAIAPAPTPAAVPTTAPAPNCGAPETRPAAMPGPKIPSATSASDARMTVAASSRVTSPGVISAVTAPKRVEPMPTITASTMSLIPDEMTFPRTRSARNEVLFHSAKGMRTKPASVVSLNSMTVTKSWIARKKNAKSVMSQARNRMAMVTKLTKKPTGPVRSPISSSKGCPAVKPVSATKPGRSRSAAVMVEPDAFRPSCAKLSKMTLARNAKLLRMRAKNPT